VVDKEGELGCMGSSITAHPALRRESAPETFARHGACVPGLATAQSLAIFSSANRHGEQLVPSATGHGGDLPGNYIGTA